MGKLPTIRPVVSQPQSQQAPLPVVGFGGSAPVTGWNYFRRYTVNPASGDTTPLGDIVVPPKALAMMIIWRARDTSANNFASFVNMQVGVNGGAIDTGANYDWGEVSGGTGVAPVNAGGNAVTSISAVVSAGGGQGASAWNRGFIFFPVLGIADQTVMAWQSTTILPAGGMVTRQGAGNYRTGGVLTRVHFFAGAGSLQAGTTFDVSALLQT